MAKPPTEPTRKQVASKVFEVASGTSGIGARSGIDDIPKDFARADGAREIAVLTLTALSDQFTFKPVMEALEKLAALKDWSHEFMVAHMWETSGHKRPAFDWREAPFRKYQSFEDFYRRELEAVWGDWNALRQTYARVVSGEISEADAHGEIERKAAAARERDAKDRENVRPAHRPKSVDNNKNNIHSSRPSGTSTEAALRRLRKDRPDIHARVLAGEITANAGMIEAGFRKKASSRKLSKVERITKMLDGMTRTEQRAVLNWLTAKFGK